MTKILTLGYFDLFHIGHLNLLKKAKQQGDFLVVGVGASCVCKDIKGKTPVMSMEDRLRIVQSIKWVDLAIGFEGAEEEEKLILAIEPDIICRGDDDKNKPIIKAAKKMGIKIVYFPYTQNISSTIMGREYGFNNRT